MKNQEDKDEVFDEKDDKIAPGEIETDSPSLKKIDNFWYHYKWTVIISAFFIIVIAVCLIQSLSREKEDIRIVYAGNYYMSMQESDALSKAVCSVMPSDFDGNGKKTCAIAGYEIYSAKEIEEINGKDKKDENGNIREINTKYNSDQYDNLKSYVASGEMTICFASRFIYDDLMTGGRIAAISDIVGTDTEISGILPDGCGIILKDTDFYKYFDNISFLSEGTVLFILKQPVMGASSKDDVYNNACDVFRAIINYKADTSSTESNAAESTATVTTAAESVTIN